MKDEIKDINGIKFSNGRGFLYFICDDNFQYLSISNEENEKIEEALFYYEHFMNFSEDGGWRRDGNLHYNLTGYAIAESEGRITNYSEIYQKIINCLNNPFVHEESKKEILETLHDKRISPIKNEKIKKNKTSGHIYLIESLGYYKIGKTKKLTDRMKTFNTIFPAKIKEIHVFQTNDITGAELSLHNKFSHLRYIGEWFNLSKEDVDYICSIKDYDM